MSIKVLVSDQPHRVVALVTETHALSFKHVQPGNAINSAHNQISVSSSTNRQAIAPRCMVEFLPKDAVNIKGYRTLTTARGTLGLITLGDDVFVCVATGSREVATVRPNETVMQLFAVEFYCLNRPDYDQSNGVGAGYREPNSNALFESDDAGNDSLETFTEHPFAALKKLLSSGSFYYSLNFDLTRRLQDRADADSTLDISSLDEGLLWNSYMINPLLSFRTRLTEDERASLDRSSLLTSVIRGYVGTMTVPQNANPLRSVRSTHPATLTVISRLSARRAGTRFNARGVDDNGNVANFVETETVFWSPAGLCFSYVQIRGSIPIFWESASTLIPGQQKVQISRSPEATQLSFDRHFENLAQTYGIIHVVNLLSETKPGEVELTERYNLHLTRSSLRQAQFSEKSQLNNHDSLRKTEFDFHEVSRAAGGYDGAKRIRPLIADSADNFVYFLTQDIDDEIDIVQAGRVIKKSIMRPVVVMHQNGVFRTNCLDCLDRTNLVQGLISQTALELFLEHRGEVANSSNLSVFWMRHSTLWADNGDALSKIYAGTGALKSSFTRHGKMSLGGLMADARKSATRLYVNHFEDKGRQNTTDLLLGRLVGQEEVELVDPISDWVHERLRLRSNEFESSEDIQVWVGTYNLNGQMLKDVRELHKWLQVGQNGGFDIVVVGFQEIVELSPQQIMNTDSARRIQWEQAVKRVINDESQQHNQDQYILLRSGQLVGAALMIFVKTTMLSKIKNVEGSIKKTGMSGIAGNKGAVAIRMDIAGSTICFVTAHLAAGFGNYDERNRDYQTIVTGLRFQRDRKVEDHEVVIWLGDFNYRIGTKYEDARELINAYNNVKGVGPKAEAALQNLYRNDQLNIQMVAGQTFPFYYEGQIDFLPTYKFDLGTDNYDSSEKARIPAWTDRILYKVDPSKGTELKQTAYSSVMNLRFSDHRPVYSTFDVKVRVIDEAHKSALSQELYSKRSKQIRDNIEEDDLDSSDEAEELMGYHSIAPGLPPASSDKRKWWLDGDKPVASTLGPPRPGMILNRNRSPNPWREGEDDWVVVEHDNNASKPKPPPPQPRSSRAKTPATTDSESRSRTAPTLPARTTEISSTTASMADAWPHSRNGSTNTPSRPSPAPPAPRNSKKSNQPVYEVEQTANISRSPSLASTTTSASFKSAKQPPQRPAKPSALSSQRTSIASPEGLTFLPPKPEAAVEADVISDTQPPPLPRRTNTTQSILSTNSVQSNGPPLPPRIATGPNRTMDARSSHDLLSDESYESRDTSWKPLMPSR